MCVRVIKTASHFSLYIQCLCMLMAAIHVPDVPGCRVKPNQVNKGTSDPTLSFCFHSIHKRLPPAPLGHALIMLSMFWFGFKTFGLSSSSAVRTEKQRITFLMLHIKVYTQINFYQLYCGIFNSEREAMKNHHAI